MRWSRASGRQLGAVRADAAGPAAARPLERPPGRVDGGPVGSDRGTPTRRAGAAASPLPEAGADALAAFERFLAVERGRSAHTVRAYLGDVRALLEFAAADGVADPADLDLALLRAWLAAMTSEGLARTTVARRGASARAFTGWLRRTGRVGQDPGARLRSPSLAGSRQA